MIGEFNGDGTVARHLTGNSRSCLPAAGRGVIVQELTPAVSGRGERIRASGPLDRVVRWLKIPKYDRRSENLIRFIFLRLHSLAAQIKR